MIFKGGTSLSKGWDLIQRFSEDIDIFLDPTGFAPPLGKKGIDRELKGLRQQFEQHPGLRFVEKESQTIGGFGRNDRFEYAQRFAGAGEVKNRVFVEAGTASGREPTARVALQSYVGQFLRQIRRTFVEKMFAIHAKVEAFKNRGKDLGGYARHYYDLYCLAGQPEVLVMLRSDEYAVIRADYDRVSRAHFAKSYVPPADMSFARSDALFPAAELRQRDRGRVREAVPAPCASAPSRAGTRCRRASRSFGACCKPRGRRIPTIRSSRLAPSCACFRPLRGQRQPAGLAPQGDVPAPCTRCTPSSPA